MRDVDQGPSPTPAMTGARRYAAAVSSPWPPLWAFPYG